jgi:hypothetical protein
MKAEQAVTRTYEYHGCTIVVAVESDSGWRLVGGAAAPMGYVTIVRICKRYFRRCASVRRAVARLRRKRMP